MKKFISISPFQSPERFSKGIYEAVDNDKLKYDCETKFPIIPTINGYAEEDEEIELITVVADYVNATENYEALKKETEKLAAEKNIKVLFKSVVVPYSDDIDAQLDMFGKLIDCTADEDRLFCDITYGTKPMTQTLTMALNYGYRIHNDVVLGCIVYGSKDHNNQKMKIYDMTSLNYMDEVVRLFAEYKISNPTERIKEMLK